MQIRVLRRFLHVNTSFVLGNLHHVSTFVSCFFYLNSTYIVTGVKADRSGSPYRFLESWKIQETAIKRSNLIWKPFANEIDIKIYTESDRPAVNYRLHD